MLVSHFICHKLGANVSNFTDGKKYKAIKESGSELVYSIVDDIGHTRIVLSDNQPSPHLVQRGVLTQKSVGIFEPVCEDQNEETN
jgi:hypothetical protein